MVLHADADLEAPVDDRDQVGLPGELEVADHEVGIALIDDGDEPAASGRGDLRQRERRQAREQRRIDLEHRFEARGQRRDVHVRTVPEAHPRGGAGPQEACSGLFPRHLEAPGLRFAHPVGELPVELVDRNEESRSCSRPPPPGT